MRPWIPRTVLDASDGSLARSVFLILLAIFTATFGGLPAGPDAEVAFQTTSSVWRRGSLALGGTPEAEGLIAFARSQPAGGFSVRPGAGAGEGEYYGWYGIGQVLTTLPFYGAGALVARIAPETQVAHEGHQRYEVERSEYFQHLFVGWCNSLLTACVGGLLVLAARHLGLSRWTAFLCGLGYGLATFAWPQARDSLGDVHAAFYITIAFFVSLQLRSRLTTRNAALFGVALAMAFLTRAVLLPAVLAFDVFFFWMLRRLQQPFEAPLELGSTRILMCASLLPQVLALTLWLVTNHLRFDAWLDSGYGLAIDGGLFGGHPLVALAGLLISPSKGLLWMAPALVLLASGLPRARHNIQGSLVLLILGVFVAVILPVLFLRGWHGAHTFGPRYLLPALPLLWLLASVGFQRTEFDGRVRPIALALLAAGVVIQFPAALVDTLTYHDLAVRAAAERFESKGNDSQADREADAFEAMQFDWGFAAPWAHWRILRHRVALHDDKYSAADIFRWPTELELSPAQVREASWNHLAWFDLRRRLHTPIWPILAALGLIFSWGVIEAIRGLSLK